MPNIGIDLAEVIQHKDYKMSKTSSLVESKCSMEHTSQMFDLFWQQPHF